MIGKWIYRSREEPNRECSSFDERWNGGDKGLILCWEIGRDIRKEQPDLVECAHKGELPLLGWKGGIDKQVECKKLFKYGTLCCLAQWQGLRGDDLDIALSEEPQMTCTATKKPKSKPKPSPVVGHTVPCERLIIFAANH